MSKNISIYQKRICRHYEENEKMSYVRAFIRKKAESNLSENRYEITWLDLERESDGNRTIFILAED